VAIAQRGPGARPMRRSRVTRVAPRSSARRPLKKWVR
jgi:hypothetical protein